jgi:hypothetical protein
MMQQMFIECLLNAALNIHPNTHLGARLVAYLGTCLDAYLVLF